MKFKINLAKIKKHAKACALAASATLGTMAISPEALAQHAHWHGDIAHFHGHDWNVWRGGHWNHGWHNGRLGWWWLAGSAWYFYPAPVYPYPSPWEPPVETLVTPGVAAAPAPPPTQFWYYCDASRAYYPYVATCMSRWRQVPANPAPPN